jgi:hypothetical protein
MASSDFLVEPFKKRRQPNPMMLEDFSNEVLTEIFSYLGQKDLLLSVALVCKTFREFTKSYQLMPKFVNYQPKSYLHLLNSSLMDMLRINPRVEKLVLNKNPGSWVLKVLKIVAPHGNLRHLELQSVCVNGSDQEDWQEALTHICPKLKVLNIGQLWTTETHSYDCLAPIVNATYLKTLTLGSVPTSETFRQMANYYTCLQNVLFDDMFYVDCSECSDLAYFLDKQSETLTSLTISTWSKEAMIAISKCQNLKKLHLKSRIGNIPIIHMNGLGRLSNLRCLSLTSIKTIDLGNIIEDGKFAHLNEIEFSDMPGLSISDVSQIARTYGQQVMKNL